MAPGSCTLQCSQLEKCTQGVQLNIGLSKVCARVFTEAPLALQGRDFCAERKFGFLPSGHKDPMLVQARLNSLRVFWFLGCIFFYNLLVSFFEKGVP